MRISDWSSDVCSSDLTARGISQEALALRAGVERSHLGKIERGEHQPNLGLVLKIAVTLDCSAAELLAATEARLPRDGSGPIAKPERVRSRRHRDIAPDAGISDDNGPLRISPASGHDGKVSPLTGVKDREMLPPRPRYPLLR